MFSFTTLLSISQINKARINLQIDILQRSISRYRPLLLDECHLWAHHWQVSIYFNQLLSHFPSDSVIISKHCSLMKQYEDLSMFHTSSHPRKFASYSKNLSELKIMFNGKFRTCTGMKPIYQPVQLTKHNIFKARSIGVWLNLAYIHTSRLLALLSD